MTVRPTPLRKGPDTERTVWGEREKEEPVAGHTAWLAVLWFLKNSHWDLLSLDRELELEPLEGKVGIFSLSLVLLNARWF